jgi:hypothetical protein
LTPLLLLMSAMSTVRPITTSFRPRGMLVWLLAGLVFALGLLNAAPSLHERLHAHDHATVHNDAGCAVTLFAHGVTTPLDLPQVNAPRTACIATLSTAPDRLDLTSADHLHPPGQAPPLLG